MIGYYKTLNDRNHYNTLTYITRKYVFKFDEYDHVLNMSCLRNARFLVKQFCINHLSPYIRRMFLYVYMQLWYITFTLIPYDGYNILPF